MPETQRSTTEYDAVGNTFSVTDFNGDTITYNYDAQNRLVEKRVGETSIASFSYTPTGQLETVTDNRGVTSYAYNELGRLLSRTDPDGQYLASGASIEYGYDAAGNRTSVTTPTGTVEYAFDSQNRLKTVTDDAGVTSYSYDEVGNLIRTELPNGVVETRTYDELSRLESVSYVKDGTLIASYDYTLDPVGHRRVVEERDGRQVEYEYDDLYRLTREAIADPVNGNRTIEYTYDAVGNRLSRIDWVEGTTTYVYDESDRLISRTDPSGPYIAESGATIEYEYDRAGNVTSITTAAGTTQYFYDEQNRLEKVIDSSAGETRYTYDLVGNLIATELPNGALETRDYNEANQLESLETVRTNDSGGEEVISSFHYTFDAAGNRQSIRDKNGGRVEYEYDNLYRLTKETILNESGAVDRTIAYTYDSVGNRLTRDDSIEGFTTYTYDDNGRLRFEELKKDNVVIATLEYDYDDNGNVISRVKNGSEETLYFWDEKNRLVQVETFTGNTISYSYDSDGIRVSTALDGQTTTYLVDKNRDYAQVIEERIDDELVVRYTYGLDSIAQQRSDRTSFYHVDGLGSTRALTDIDGNLTDTYSYDAYGNLLHSTGNTTNNYLYTGEQYDPNLDNYYLRARYYDSGLGRFNAPDPFGGLMTEPLSIAKYPSAHGNPVNAIDPSGLFPELTMGGLSNTLAVAGILAAMYWPTVNLLGFVVESEPLPPLGGFDETPVPVPNHTGHPRTEPLPPLGGFGEGEDDIGELPSNPPFPNWQMGLRELLEWYVFSHRTIYDDPGILEEDYELHELANQIADDVYAGDAIARAQRPIAVGRIEGSGQKVIVSAFGEIAIPKQDEYRQQGYIVLRETRGSGAENHAERRLIRWGETEGYNFEAIGVSHRRGICSTCWEEMQEKGIRRASLLYPKIYKQ